MLLEGTVINGTIVLDGNEQLPEGAPASKLPSGNENPSPPRAPRIAPMPHRPSGKP